MARMKYIMRRGMFRFRIAFIPRLVARDRFMFEIVKETGNKHGIAQYKTFKIREDQMLLTPEKVRSMGYNVESLIRRFIRLRKLRVCLNCRKPAKELDEFQDFCDECLEHGIE